MPPAACCPRRVAADVLTLTTGYHVICPCPLSRYVTSRQAERTVILYYFIAAALVAVAVLPYGRLPRRVGSWPPFWIF